MLTIVSAEFATVAEFKPGERAGHLCNLMRRRDEYRALADMAASATLGFKLAITGLAETFGIRLPA